MGEWSSLPPCPSRGSVEHSATMYVTYPPPCPETICRFINQMWVDVPRLEVVSLDLKPSKLATQATENIPLTALRQIGAAVVCWN